MKKIAVIGAGYWGKNLVRNFHDFGILALVCDSNDEVLKQISKEYDVDTTSSFSETLEREDIKGIAIATPVTTHYQMVKEALLAGKDVFVEKPVALSTAEAQELVEIAEENNRILMVGHLLRYHTAVPTIKEMMDAGKLGKIHYIYSSRLNFGKIRKEENILLSFAPHDVSVILYLLEEMPEYVSAHAGYYLQHEIADTTLSHLYFKNGVQAHIFVSWLHPFKEQKLVVVGEKGMLVFNDTDPRDKLLFYPHKVSWAKRIPVADRAEGESIEIDDSEPLRLECQHFLYCIENRKRPETDGKEGLRVLRVLNACQVSMNQKGVNISLGATPHFIHPTSIVDEPCEIGEGTKVWHFSHVMKNAKIGKNCNIGQNVFIGSGVIIGNNVKIQNNVSVYEGVRIEDDVFCGPSMVFTNVTNPRSFISRKHEYKETLIKRGATIGANATIVCGHKIGEYALIGAGAVVTKDVPDYALVMGNPARIAGWICECGAKLDFGAESTKCGECKKEYEKLAEDKVVRRV